MVVALFMALLLPVTASAQIRTATPAEKTAILAEIALGLKARQDMTDRHAEAHAAKAKGDDNGFVRLMTQAVTAESGMHEHLNRALAKTQVAYHVGPEVGAGDQIIANGPLQGATRSYSPVFFPETGGKTRKVERLPYSYENHYLRFEPISDLVGGTWEDGMVMVRLLAFQTAQKTGNPGQIAYILQHEAVHFNDLVTTGWHTMEQSERHAYEEDLKTAAVFELSKKRIALIEQKKNEHARKIWLHENVPFGPALHRPFPSASQEDDNRRAYESEQTHKSEFELDREKLREIQDSRQAARAASDKDHDERLKNTYLDLADRSCASPGSVTQAELESLPKPHNKAAMTEPPGLTGCLSSVYQGLRSGATAEDLERYSTPKRAADPSPQLGPYNPPRKFVPATPDPLPPFENVLPKLSSFAAEACRAPETVSIRDFQARNDREHFYYDYSYMGRDADIAAGLSSSLDECSKALFRRLIAMHRGMQYQEIRSIDRQWIRTFVAANSRVPDTTSGYTPPSGGGRGRRCEDYGNINCPK